MTSAGGPPSPGPPEDHLPGSQLAVSDKPSPADSSLSAPDSPREPLPQIQDTVAVVFHPATRQPLLACIARRTYSFSPTGKLTVADSQDPLTIEPVMSDHPIDACAMLLDDTDLLAPKEATDIILVGTACARKRVKEHFIAVALGNIVRRLRVIGPRHADVSPDGAVKFSPADAFEKQKLTPELAYGGYDEYAQTKLAPVPLEQIYLLGHKPVGLWAYPRNAAGTAYFIDVDRPRADGAPLPRIEDPSDPLTQDRFFVPVPEAWMDAPIPGVTGWLPHATYPRFLRYFGDKLPHLQPTRRLRELDLGCGPDLLDQKPLARGEIHPRALQGASPGLALERLRGDELGILQGLLPEADEVRFSLPAESPHFSLAIPDVKKLFSPRPTLQTVRIDTDKKTLSLTWCATLPLLARAQQSFLDQCELDVEWGRL